MRTRSSWQRSSASAAGATGSKPFPKAASNLQHFKASLSCLGKSLWLLVEQRAGRVTQARPSAPSFGALQELFELQESECGCGSGCVDSAHRPAKKKQVKKE